MTSINLDTPGKEPHTIHPRPTHAMLVMERASACHGDAGIHFFYDFYPIMVEYAEKKTSFLQFLTSVCAIVGGIFTVST